MSVTPTHEGSVRTSKPRLVEQPQRAGGEAVAAGLVAGEGGLVDDERVEPEPAGLDAGGDPGRTGPDDQHVEQLLRQGVVKVLDGTHVSHRWRRSRQESGHQ